MTSSNTIPDVRQQQLLFANLNVPGNRVLSTFNESILDWHAAVSLDLALFHIAPQLSIEQRNAIFALMRDEFQTQIISLGENNVALKKLLKKKNEEIKEIAELLSNEKEEYGILENAHEELRAELEEKETEHEAIASSLASILVPLLEKSLQPAEPSPLFADTVVIHDKPANTRFHWPRWFSRIAAWLRS